jgi:hypothetical protein
MKLTFICISVVLLGLILGEASKADKDCVCISVWHQTLANNTIQYVAKCVQPNGEETTLISTKLPSLEEAKKATDGYKNQYKIKDTDCIQLPGGKMQYAPKNK